MKKRKILYISGTRADYGLMKRTLFAIKNNPKLELELIVTGMHLMPEFDKTINEIKRDGFNLHQIKAIYKNDTKKSMAEFIGRFVLELVRKIKIIKPNIILILGDRPEMLGAAIVSNYLAIPVAHIHGGEKTSTVDDIARHAITKLSHIHFPATQKSAERIKKMGEERKRIFIVGAPGIEIILKEKLFSQREIAKKYNLDLNKPILLILQHSVTVEAKNAAKQMKETMEAIKELDRQSIVIYPNADVGGRAMIRIIEKYRKYKFIKIFKNIPHRDYLSLMRIVSVLIGNSSSGIIEAPSFNLPVVNIGSRQGDRQRAKNIIDTDYHKIKIKKAIVKAIYLKKTEKKTKLMNPYWQKGTSQKISNILKKIKIDENLFQKKMSY